MKIPISLTLHPATMLLIGFFILGILIWIFWTKKGLFFLLSKIRMNNQRMLWEDALKFLFNCEYKNIPCELNSLAGNLKISPDKTARLLDRLHYMGLITLKDHFFRLTDAGRSYSLRIIRVHRIWEKYLADKTGIGQMEWHEKADYQEHQISTEDANKLAARMGNPIFDPHGDPIPSAKGELPKHKGQPLTSLKEGEIARILHIEDEPQGIYQQLVVQGLYPGMQVYILDVDNHKITFAAEGEECVLTHLFASSITVEVLPGNVSLTPKYELLSSLQIGEKAEIAGISPICRGQQRRRLMDLGVVPGSTITAEIRSASGDPVGYRIMDAIIGIRKNQADLIYIKKNIQPNEQPTSS